MPKRKMEVNADPLSPAKNADDWEAQGWSTEPRPLSAAARLETTISIRFDPESAALLRRAARIVGQTKSQFVREVTLKEARRTLEANSLPASMWLPEGREELATTQSRSSLSPPQTAITKRSAQELVPR